MEDDSPSQQRRLSTRTRKVASRMVAALASSDNRSHAALARLEALESDNAVPEAVDLNDDEDASLDDDDDVGYLQKRQSKGTKRKTRQAKALENARKAPKTFLELLHEVLVNTILTLDISLWAPLFPEFILKLQANLEALPPHVPSYLRAAVGPPGSTSRRHFCTVCGFTTSYTCVRCGLRFCSIRCQNIHNDTRCLKFVA